MKNELLRLDALACTPDDIGQLAAYLIPAIRGICKPCAFPCVRFLAEPTLTGDSFRHCFPSKNTVYIPSRPNLQSLYQSIDTIPSGSSLVGVEGVGIFAIAKGAQKANRLLEAYKRGIPLSDNSDPAPNGRMQGRVIVVTGGAQGLGKGISNILLREGAHVAIADLNTTLAQQTAEEFARAYGQERVAAIPTDVSNDQSVEALCKETILQFGGIDVMFSNAGIVLPGDLEQMTSEKMYKVANINYIGYFRCTKYSSRYMKIQSAFDPSFTADIINTSSVAGLIGYQKNFAYCGSKFAVLGLTECFAKELLPHRIKVNSVCPGNYFDGPLWNDPEKGLFLQYLKAGKIPGGKNVQDSKDYYLSREPLHRGCQPEDIAAAVLYCIEQQFETGIALPVTGGLSMGAI